MDRKLLQDVRERASLLEASAARLSGSFYWEDGYGRDTQSLMYVQALGWDISDDMNQLLGASPRMPDIVSGLYRPIEIRRALPSFRSTAGHYPNSHLRRATRQDPLTVYQWLLSDLPTEIGPMTLVPREETRPLQAYALHVLLDHHAELFDAQTGFRTYASKHRYPFDPHASRQARPFLANLKTAADFPLEQLLDDYVRAVRDAGPQKGRLRPVPPYRLFWERATQHRGKRTDELYTVDEEQYGRMLCLRDTLLDALHDSARWDRNDILRPLANFYFEANPWNYLTYFEAKESHNREAVIAPSKRREEPVYIDYTGNTERIRQWLDAVFRGTPVSHLALIGPAGIGKTAGLLQVAAEQNVKIVNVDLDIVTQGYLPSVLEQVRRMSEYPFVIYIDNIDMPEGLEARSDMLFYFRNNLERQMEGPTALGQRVKFAMSTSTYDELPPALRQRFSVAVRYRKPLLDEQRAIVAAHAAQLGFDTDPNTVLHHAYGAGELDAIAEQDFKTPRELKDAVVSYSFEN